MTLQDLQTPCLLLDEAKLRRNVAGMQGHLARLGVAFRPHLKTAKSRDVARVAMTSPTGPAMVSTLREAEYFAEGGVTDMIYGVLPNHACATGAQYDRYHVLDGDGHVTAIWPRINGW